MYVVGNHGYRLVLGSQFLSPEIQSSRIGPNHRRLNPEPFAHRLIVSIAGIKRSRTT